MIHITHQKTIATSQIVPWLERFPWDKRYEKLYEMILKKELDLMSRTFDFEIQNRVMFDVINFQVTFYFNEIYDSVSNYLHFSWGIHKALRIYWISVTDVCTVCHREVMKSLLRRSCSPQSGESVSQLTLSADEQQAEEKRK